MYAIRSYYALFNFIFQVIRTIFANKLCGGIQYMKGIANTNLTLGWNFFKLIHAAYSFCMGGNTILINLMKRFVVIQTIGKYPKAVLFIVTNPFKFLRITSYNVCYTKLLRFRYAGALDHFRSIKDGPFRMPARFI